MEKLLEHLSKVFQMTDNKYTLFESHSVFDPLVSTLINLPVKLQNSLIQFLCDYLGSCLETPTFYNRFITNVLVILSLSLVNKKSPSNCYLYRQPELSAETTGNRSLSF